MTALDLVTTWPVDTVAAAAVDDGGVRTIGDTARPFRLASLTKPIVAWAVLIAVEEGIVELDGPLRHAAAPDGATLRHLLAHAAGFGFDGPEPIAPVGRRRIYSNTGIERAADEVEAAAGITFDTYLAEAVLSPLGMASSELRGSPAHAMWSSVDDVVRFLAELRSPSLVDRATWADAVRPQFPGLAGIVPDVGRFDPCPWGLGVEIKGAKAPHWMGRANAAATFGHFGGAGTMMWVDPDAGAALVALTDRPFDQWRDDALRCWPELSDAVLAESGPERGA